jgi:hypothetical protein
VHPLQQAFGGRAKVAEMPDENLLFCADAFLGQRFGAFEDEKVSAPESEYALYIAISMGLKVRYQTTDHQSERIHVRSL